ncbi:MAG: hypothetical protein NTV80_15195, partial [Verrucomicrobia bacterium]|nr:hypothetical protein [Verrucomicrobiota bacterium]
PTPIAAAELLAPHLSERKPSLETTHPSKTARVQSVLYHHERELELTAKGPLMHEPERQIQQAEQSIDDAEARLTSAIREQLRSLTDQLTDRQQVLQQYHPRVMISEAGHRVQSSADRLRQLMEHRLVRLEDRLRARADLLRNLGPDSILSRGFSYTMTAGGKRLRDAKDIQKGDKLVTKLQRGEVTSIVQ